MEQMTELLKCGPTDAGGSTGGQLTLKSVCKSVSCTTELCVCSSEAAAEASTNHKPAKMIVSNSSASLLKARNYLQYHRPSQSSQTPAKARQIWLEAADTTEREHWDKKIEFLLAVIGFAVDLGNVWRFPYICYRNGGGAFLIPYTVMLLFGGLPLFYLELALGQYYSSGCLTIWKHLCPIMKGLGYAICIIDIYMAMYYNTIIAWAVYYLYVSLQSLSTFTLPWQVCSNHWNTAQCQTLEQRRLQPNITLATITNSSSSSSVFEDDESTSISPAQEYFVNHVLHMDASTGIDSLGPIQPSLAICLMLVFITVYFSIWKGIKSSGKAVWVTALLPYFVIFVLLIRGTTLDGASDGIRYYLSPDWEKLKSLQVWIDAATQIFFSLGPGFGTLLALSSYNKFHNNCYRDAIFTSCVNCLTSFVAGFVTFSVLGYMAKKLNKDISKVATDGPGLVFIVYPEAISTMYGSVFFSILFFVMLITLGLDSTGGNYLITLIDHHGTSLSVLFVVFIETIAICWLYGSERFSLQIKEMLGKKPGIFWRTCWISLCPLFLGFVAMAAIIKREPLRLDKYEYPEWSVVVGWLITFSSLACIPLYAIYHVLNTPGDSWSGKLLRSFRPTLVAVAVNDTETKVNEPNQSQPHNDIHDKEVNDIVSPLGDAV